MRAGANGDEAQPAGNCCSDPITMSAGQWSTGPAGGGTTSSASPARSATSVGNRV